MNADLNSQEATTLLGLADGLNRQRGEFRMSVSGLAKLLKLSEAQTRRRLRALEHRGLIVPTRRNAGGRDASGRGVVNAWRLGSALTGENPCACAGVDPRTHDRVNPSTDAQEPLHGCATAPAPMRPTQGNQETNLNTKHDGGGVDCPHGWDSEDWEDAVTIATNAGHTEPGRFCQRAGSFERVAFLRSNSGNAKNLAGLMERRLQENSQPSAEWVAKKRKATLRRRGTRAM